MQRFPACPSYVLISAAPFVAYFCLFSVTLAPGDTYKTLGVTVSQWSTLISSTTVVLGAIDVAVCTSLIDIIHRPLLTGIVLCASGVLAILVPLFHDSYGFLLGRQILSAFLLSSVSPCCMSLAHTLFEEKVTLVLQSFTTSGTVAALAVCQIFGGILHHRWMYGVALSGCACICVGLLFPLVVSEGGSGKRPNLRDSCVVIPTRLGLLGLILVRVRSILIGCLFLSLLSAQFTMTNFLTMWLVFEKSAEPSNTSIVLGALSLVFIPGSLFVSLLADGLKDKFGIPVYVASATTMDTMSL